MSQSPNRLLGIFIGIIFLIVGLLGFVVATPYPFATAQGGVLIGLFGVNGALSSIHVVLGAILVLCALSGTLSAKIAGILIGGGVFAFGLFGWIAAHTAANIFALNGGDNLLHFLAGAVLLIVGFGSDRVVIRKPAV